jgi:hypothetical protein
VDDRGGDAEDLLRLVGDRDLDALAVLPIHPLAARRHRPVGVVDPLDEVAGLEVRGLVALWQRRRVRPAAADE